MAVYVGHRVTVVWSIHYEDQTKFEELHLFKVLLKVFWTDHCWCWPKDFLKYFPIWDHWLISELENERLNVSWMNVIKRLVGWFPRSSERVLQGAQPGLLHPDLGWGEEQVVVVLSLRLPTLFPPLRLEEQLVVQFLLGLLRQVGNFYCFCLRHLVKWNPLVWKPETHRYSDTRLSSRYEEQDFCQKIYIVEVKVQLKYVFIAQTSKSKFAIFLN